MILIISASQCAELLAWYFIYRIVLYIVPIVNKSILL
jgi:hypothetical protein